MPKNSMMHESIAQQPHRGSDEFLDLCVSRQGLAGSAPREGGFEPNNADLSQNGYGSQVCLLRLLNIPKKHSHLHVHLLP